MITTSNLKQLSKQDKYNLNRLLMSRRKLLSLAVLFFMPAILFFTFYIIAEVGIHFITYGIISLTYLYLFLVWKKNIFLTLCIAVVFYLVHTALEMQMGLDLNFLTDYGLAKNESSRPSSLYLIFIDIIIISYPIVRYLLVLSLMQGIWTYREISKAQNKLAQIKSLIK